MKLMKLFVLFFLLIGFASCESYHAKDTVDGTPTRADTVLPAHGHGQPLEPAKTEEAPKIYRR
jgi:hypothetical protein